MHSLPRGRRAPLPLPHWCLTWMILAATSLVNSWNSIEVSIVLSRLPSMLRSAALPARDALAPGRVLNRLSCKRQRKSRVSGRTR